VAGQLRQDRASVRAAGVAVLGEDRQVPARRHGGDAEALFDRADAYAALVAKNLEDHAPPFGGHARSSWISYAGHDHRFA
jgi:hypothetical protein